MGIPFLPRRTQVAVKVEGTEGTDAVPTASDVIHPVFGVEYTPEFTMFNRDVVQPSLSRLRQISAEQQATITFSTELKGSGTAVDDPPPNLSAPFQGCGMAETITGATNVVYDPSSASNSSVTVEIRELEGATVAKIKKIVGARGTFTIEAVKSQAVLVNFTFTGRYVEPTEGVALTVPTPSPVPEPFLNVGFSFHGVSTLNVQNVTLDIGNELSTRNDVNQATGNFSTVIVARNPVGSIDPEQELIATINFFNKLTTDATGVLTYTLGGTAFNIVTINCPAVEIINIAEADRDSFRTEAIDLQLSQSGSAGDDEIKLTFT